MQNFHFEKHLRTHQTEEESKLWYNLRAKRFSKTKFRRQVKIGTYIVDFVCYQKRLIIELDGGQHDEANARQYDANRTAYLQAEGFTVIRFWNHDINENLEGVLTVIAEMLDSEYLHD